MKPDLVTLDVIECCTDWPRVCLPAQLPICKEKYLASLPHDRRSLFTARDGVTNYVEPHIVGLDARGHFKAPNHGPDFYKDDVSRQLAGLGPRSNCAMVFRWWRGHGVGIAVAQMNLPMLYKAMRARAVRLSALEKVHGRGIFD